MYKFMLAFRYLYKRRISYFSLFAVALCVFVVLIVITVLSGLTAEFKKNTHLWSGDCIVSSRSLVGFCYYEEFMELLEEESYVQAVTPIIRSYAMVQNASDSISSFYIDRTLEVLGVEAKTYSEVTGFDSWLCYNKGKNFEKVFESPKDANVPGCVIGISLRFDRDPNGFYIIDEPPLYPDKLTISCFPLTAKGALARAGTDVISEKTFLLRDVAQSSIKADWQTIYIPYEQAQLLCGMAGEAKRTSEIFIKFKKGTNIQNGCSKVKSLWKGFTYSKKDTAYANLFENVRIQDWKNYNSDMIAVAETQQSLMILVFILLGIITVFIVFVVFFMIVSHKSKDIGILKSLGVSNGGMMFLFLNFAFLTGFIGAVIGALGGWQFLVHINTIEDMLFRKFDFQLFDRTIYAIGDIPNSIDLQVLFIIIIAAVAGCLMGAYLPSRMASKKEPAQTLQVNKL